MLLGKCNVFFKQGVFDDVVVVGDGKAAQCDHFLGSDGVEIKVAVGGG
jgi:hypothetical protein